MQRTTSSQARKKDTRDKIELGGLIIKAGLHVEKRAVLFGSLMELACRLKSDEDERTRLGGSGDDSA